MFLIYFSLNTYAQSNSCLKYRHNITIPATIYSSLTLNSDNVTQKLHWLLKSKNLLEVTRIFSDHLFHKWEDTREIFYLAQSMPDLPDHIFYVYYYKLMEILNV